MPPKHPPGPPMTLGNMRELGGGRNPMLVGRTNRRAFIAALGSAAAWPVVARGQPAAMPGMGFLNSGSPAAAADQVEAFRQGLKENGFLIAQNVTLDFRWVEGR